MDPAKVEFLFGRVPTWADTDDRDDRSVLLREQRLGRRDDDVGRFGLAMYEAIADQIANGEPPEVWETARCDEPVPPLSGMTPRQAAADPTRRETLERLLASFEDRSAPLTGAAWR
ncbi:MAG TPA: hypothetical protein VIH70_03415 [Actinomycetota bacterium]